METWLGTEQVHTMGESREIDDQYIIIGVGIGRERPQVLERIRSEFGEAIEVLAPTERRMLRPRRKTSRTQPLIIERPIFFQYVAIKWPFGEHGWHKLRNIFGVRFILLDGNKPCLVSRDRLFGMLEKHREDSWEDSAVEIVSGPFKGQHGTYKQGKVQLEMLGRKIWAKIDVFVLRKKKDERV